MARYYHRFDYPTKEMLERYVIIAKLYKIMPSPHIGQYLQLPTARTSTWYLVNKIRKIMEEKREPIYSLIMTKWNEVEIPSDIDNIPYEYNNSISKPIKNKGLEVLLKEKKEIQKRIQVEIDVWLDENLTVCSKRINEFLTNGISFNEIKVKKLNEHSINKINNLSRYLDRLKEIIETISDNNIKSFQQTKIDELLKIIQIGYDQIKVAKSIFD